VLSDAKHEPCLVSQDPRGRERFLSFIEETLRLAPLFGARVVMLHSGYAPAAPAEEAFAWLVEGTRRLARHAAELGLSLGFEFHPDMFVRTLDDYWRLRDAVDDPALGLTLDVGHSNCTDPRPFGEVIADCASEVVNVHLEDIKGRVHAHLPLGSGDIDFREVFRGLASIGYRGLVNAEFNTDDLGMDELDLARQTWEHARARL
jgi:sugar phosphate isomerase/epimerase